MYKRQALETAATGVRWDFAPMVSVVQDPRWGRTYEAFGDDTAAVTALSRAYLLGLQDAGDGRGLASPHAVLGTPKHYPVSYTHLDVYKRQL